MNDSLYSTAILSVILPKVLLFAETAAEFKPPSACLNWNIEEGDLVQPYVSGIDNLNYTLGWH